MPAPSSLLCLCPPGASGKATEFSGLHSPHQQKGLKNLLLQRTLRSVVGKREVTNTPPSTVHGPFNRLWHDRNEKVFKRTP